MTPTQELIERLRERTLKVPAPDINPLVSRVIADPLCVEAADRITELQDEVGRMREALRLIANATHPRFRTEEDIDLLYANEKAFGDCINIARAALDQQGDRGRAQPYTRPITTPTQSTRMKPVTASSSDLGNESMTKMGCVNCRWWERRDDPRARNVSVYGKCNWPAPPIIDAIEFALSQVGQSIDPSDLSTSEHHSCSGYEAVEDAAP